MERRTRRSDLVVVPRALLAHFHQSRSPQIRQMSRDRRLRQSQDFYEVTHAQFSGLNETQDSKADPVGKGPKHQIDLALGRGGHIRLSGLHQSAKVRSTTLM